jgi:hypothetical protein
LHHQAYERPRPWDCPSRLYLQYSLVLLVKWGLALQCWQNLLGLPFFGTCLPGFPEAECFLEVPLAITEADASFAFAFRPASCLSSMTCSIDSRSFRRVLVLSGRVKCVMLYWFIYKTGTELRTIPARSALLNGMFAFFVPSTAMEELKTMGRMVR